MRELSEVTGGEYLARRRSELERLVGRPLGVPARSGVPAELRGYLVEQAEELYWNDLEWEKILSRQQLQGRGTVENAFPAFLPFVEGLLLKEATADAGQPAVPRPEVVEEVVEFLAERCVALAEAAEPYELFDRLMTERLLDLVLYRLHELRQEEAVAVERAREGGRL